MGQADLRRMRFAYSPLTEGAQSLYVLHGSVVPAVYESWFESIRDRLRRVDTPALRAVLPANGRVANVHHHRSRPRARTQPATISEHLATLRRCGLLMCRRVGRRVLYEQTPLGASIAATGSRRR
jgi:hypothetical protein